MFSLPILLMLAAHLVDDQVTDLSARVRFLAEKEAPKPRAATLKTLDGVLRGQPFQLPPKSYSQNAAQESLNELEQSTEDPSGYDNLAGYVRRSKTSIGTDNPSIRARLALADLADLLRTDYQTSLPELASFGKAPVVIIFWATWCGPCQAELPLAEKLHRQGTQILAVSEEDEKIVAKYMMDNGFTFPTATGATRRQVFERFEVPAMPATRIVDADRRLRITGRDLADAMPLINRLSEKP